MAATKVQDHQEAVRWIEEGKTYSWIVEEYRRKYHIETTPQMWGNFRRKHGLERRLHRDRELIPWRVKKEHRWEYPLAMLRLVARQRRGDKLRESDQQKLDSWLKQMKEQDLVVYYDPETEPGFFLVPREPQDKDLVRMPEQIDSASWDA